ncbi:hypothetical protein V8G54_027529 [Vigna mungo]|uniref:Transmembrane protein n=1 Tax=Vigna mungo TaxID=3915 RepID=A0AAQ3N2U8_VIGMU
MGRAAMVLESCLHQPQLLPTPLQKKFNYKTILFTLTSYLFFFFFSENPKSISLSQRNHTPSLNSYFLSFSSISISFHPQLSLSFFFLEIFFSLHSFFLLHFGPLVVCLWCDSVAVLVQWWFVGGASFVCLLYRSFV